MHRSRGVGLHRQARQRGKAADNAPRLVDRLSPPSPRATSPGMRQRRATPQADAAVGTIAKILVVDDDPTKLVALRTLLEPLGDTVVEARSGADALRHLLKEDFAVILLNVRMPIINGFETAELIRQRPASELTPIIFVTALH